MPDANRSSGPLRPGVTATSGSIESPSGLPAATRPSVLDAPAAAAPGRQWGIPALVLAMRPKQWLKNLLVFAAPVASGAILRTGPLLHTFGAVGVLTAASAATYLVNDVADLQADRHHPLKRQRPIASGRVSVPAAVVSAGPLAATAMVAAFLLSASLGAVVAAYLAISTAYTFSLKRVPIVELACVASGFTLRAVAGGAAAQVAISPWFLVVVSFGALFIVAGKRSSERAILGSERAAHRPSLGAYPADFIRSVRVLAMAVTVTTYCLWAFQRARAVAIGSGSHLVWFELSIVPFVLSVLFVELAVQRGRGGEPEDLAIRDRALQCCALAWMTLVVIGVYA